MAREDEIILENLTNRGLGASPVAFREFQVSQLPTLRSALATSSSIREEEQRRQQSSLLSQFAGQGRTSRTGTGLQSEDQLDIPTIGIRGSAQTGFGASVSGLTGSFRGMI